MKKMLASFFSYALLCNALAQQVIKDSTVDYEIKILPQKDRINLQIVVSYAVSGDSSFVSLPMDCYGVPNLHEYATEIKSLDGTLLKPGIHKNERIAIPDSSNIIKILYELSYNPTSLERYAFSPNVSANHFYLAGCQWMLPIDGITSIKQYNIRFTEYPKDWKLFNSISPTSDKIITRSSYEEMMTTAIGGVKKSDFEQYIIQNNFLTISIAGEYSNLSKGWIRESVKKIVTQQRNWFNDHTQPFYHVAINPKIGTIAGTAISNLFVCFIKPGISKKELNTILAHEMFHTWLGTKMYILPEKNETDFAYEWITEGFTDYLAAKILLEAKMMTDEEFIQKINTDLYNIADNPYKNFTLDSLVKKSDNISKKLGYYRGSIIAYKWDMAIQKLSNNKKGLKDFIIDLYTIAKTNNAAVSFEKFKHLALQYGIDAKRYMDNYIANGANLLLSQTEIPSNYRLINITKPSFDVGFSLQETFKTGIITGVNLNGPAYKSGLREGMKFTHIHNAGRFTNNWSAAQPLEIVVGLDEKEVKYSYFPHGKPIELLQVVHN